MEKKIKLYTIPNLITLMNLACGCGATVFALKYGDVATAFWLIIAGAVLDFFDGFAARLLKSFSEVGKQLDSLADVVSFGLAPAAVLYALYTDMGGDNYLAYGVFIVTLFSALRLAKFNVDESQSDSFVGLPTPACAIFIGSVGYVTQVYDLGYNPHYLLVISVAMSWLLVSPIRMFALKFKNFSLTDNKLRYGFITASVVAIALWHVLAVPFVIVGYVFVSIVQKCVTFARSNILTK